MKFKIGDRVKLREEGVKDWDRDTDWAEVDEITAKDVSDENLYIQSARLNGTPLDSTHVTHTLIKDGGTLELSMGPQPSEWGK